MPVTFGQENVSGAAQKTYADERGELGRGWPDPAERPGRQASELKGAMQHAATCVVEWYRRQYIS